jgi:prepilin-type N-terminal cleavage/methylation domain-containing protein
MTSLAASCFTMPKSGTLAFMRKTIGHVTSFGTLRQAGAQQGFSLIELLIVVAISMIAAAMALPLVSNAVNQVHLSSSATDYANLLQRARMRAVQDDTYYQIQTTTLSGDPIAYVDINKNGSYDNGEPMMVFASGVTYKAQSAGPALANLKSQFLPSTAQTTLQPTMIPIFGPRGLPCAVTGSACPYLDPNTGKPYSYLLFIQNTQNNRWEAVTLNPSTRIREWAYDTRTSTWSPLN